jgi:hypothetical protein
MSLLPHDANRRAFLGDALKLGAGSLLIAPALRADGQTAAPGKAAGGYSPDMITRLSDRPDSRAGGS